MNDNLACIYRWVTKTKSEPPPLELVEPGNINVDRDCRVLAPATSTLGVNTEYYTKGFGLRLNAQHLRALKCPLPDSSTTDFEASPWSQCIFEKKPPASSSVQVAVIDSAKFSGVGLSRSQHATTMSYAVRIVAGSDVSITSYPALSLSSFRGKVMNFADDGFGGHFGSWESLSTQLRTAINEWEANKRQNKELNLIINLSLGWPGDLASQPDKSLSGPEQYIHDLLHEAACKGALIIAAAGNRSGSATGPIYPAAWETERLVCPNDGELDVAKGEKRPEIYRPLVHAIGGVEWNGNPLGTMRPAGMPRLMAAGASFASNRHPQSEQAMADATQYLVDADVGQIDENAGLELGTGIVTFSGTSVSAASVSGLAALIWKAQPKRRADEVMAFIYKGADDMGKNLIANFGAGGTLMPVKRVSVCGALAAAGMPSGGCKEASPISWTQILPEISTNSVILLPLGASVANTIVAPSKLPFPALQTLDDSALFGTDAPWVSPSPGSPTCGGCWMVAKSPPRYLKANIQPYDDNPIGTFRTTRVGPAGQKYTADFQWVSGWHLYEFPTENGAYPEVVYGYVEFFDGAGKIIGVENMNYAEQ